MKIIVNGKQVDTHAENLAQLVTELGYAGDYFAVAKNMHCIVRSRYGDTMLQDNDHIEILLPMQGG